MALFFIDGQKLVSRFTETGVVPGSGVISYAGEVYIRLPGQGTGR
jgi:hypothetical protein